MVWVGLKQVKVPSPLPHKKPYHYYNSRWITMLIPHSIKVYQSVPVFQTRYILKYEQNEIIKYT